jgi:hypothetical protein
MKPGEVRREVPDGGCAGLYLVVQPSGAKSWACRFRFEGKPRKLTLGSWPKIKLGDARKKLATDALVKCSNGIDPTVEKREAKIEAIDRSRDTVKIRAEQFIELHAKKYTRENSWKLIEGIFRHDVLPTWGYRSVHDVRRRDVIDLVEDIARVRPVMANRVLMAISKFFKWLMARDVVVASPVAGVSSRLVRLNVSGS